MESLQETRSITAKAPIPSAAPDIIEAHLRSAILGGTLKSGTPIRQQSIADEFSVSRMPVREALHRLAAKGLVTGAQNKGYYVAVGGQAGRLATLLKPLSEEYAQLASDQERTAFEAEVLRLIRAGDDTQAQSQQ